MIHHCYSTPCISVRGNRRDVTYLVTVVVAVTPPVDYVSRECVDDAIDDGFYRFFVLLFYRNWVAGIGEILFDLRLIGGLKMAYFLI